MTGSERHDRQEERAKAPAADGTIRHGSDNRFFEHHAYLTKRHDFRLNDIQGSELQLGTQSAAWAIEDDVVLEEAAPARRLAGGLKAQAAERLAAHRAQRQRVTASELFDLPATGPIRAADGRKQRIAAAVAERYAQTESYRSFLAAEAQRAVERARAAAEVAARTAEAVAAVQQQLLAELEAWLPEEIAPVMPSVAETAGVAAKPSSEARGLAAAPVFTVRLYEGAGQRQAAEGVPNAVPHEVPEEEERMALEEEIAFRKAPVFEEFQPAVALPANLIEFPRQLVAARKARPRLAEGPLREEAERAEGLAQLRIFEVEPELISTVVEPESVLPEWSSIRLEACAVTERAMPSEYAVSYPARPYTAALGLRLMAATVDGCILLATLLGFAAGAAYVAGSVPNGLVGAMAAGGALAFFAILYYLLFFTFAEATPGMRYAQIGLCTFGDDNPTRPAMRRRLFAMLLAVCPMGLGFLWALFDEDGLGWHDRISGMYQRSY